MSTSYGTITITNETEAKKAARYFLHSSGGSYVIAGTQNFSPNDESTYGYNTRIGTSEIQLRYNAIPLAEWGNNKLIFYDTTNAAIAQGSLNPLMSLTSDGLTFLKRGTNTSAAVLTGNGLEIKEGAISLGVIPSGETKHPFEVNSNGELYADNAYIKGVINATNGEFNGNINARSGKIGNWYILEGTSYVCQDDLIGEGGWTISTYNSEEQLQYYDSYGSISPRELIPTSIQIKFSGSLNGLNINDNNLYTYETPSLDTEYVIRYSNLDVAVVKVTFSGTYHTFYMTKILNDNITLEVWYYNYTIIDSDNGCLYYNNSTPGNSNSVVLSGKGKISSNSIAGSDTGLSWRMAVGNNFGVTTNGTLYASNATISGHLKALTLSTGNRTSSSTGTAGTYIDENGAIYVGSDNAFQVSAAGAVTATSGSIGGWKIGGDTAHSLWYSGSSSVTTPAGALGSGLILSPGGIYSSTKPGGSSSVLPAYKTWAFTAGDQFGVTTDGILYANGANLQGIVISGYVTEGDAEDIAEEAVKQYIKADASGIKIAKNVGSATSYNYIDSTGMKLYYDQKLSAQFSSTGLTIYNSSGSSSTEIAHFLGSGAVIKSSTSDKYISLNSNALSFYNTNSLCGSLKFSSYAASTSTGNYLNINTNYNHSYTADIKVSTNTNTSRVSIGVSAPGNYGVDLDMYCTPNNLDNNYEILSLYDNIGSTTSQELLTITANGNLFIGGTLYLDSGTDRMVGATLSGTTTPTSSIGKIGDIYIKYKS